MGGTKKGSKAVYITFEERVKIESLWKTIKSYSEIARRIGKPISTVRYEIRRNISDGEYCAKKAQQNHDTAKCIGRRINFVENVAVSISRQLQEFIETHTQNIMNELGFRKK